MPSLFDLPIGCRFHERCSQAQDRCVKEEPALERSTAGRDVRCHFPIGVPAALTVGATA